MDYAIVFKKVEQSVVNVIQVNSDQTCRDFGTGVLIGDGSKVLTCAHCVNTNFINAIYDKSTNTYHSGTIIFNDLDNDIAILDMGQVMGVPATIKSSSMMEIGNEVFTVGFPYSFPGEKTLTSGHIAAFEDGWIKIDTSVNNGNSGGPLFNANGEIIGIVNAKLGTLSEFLKNVEQAKPQAFVAIGGIDPVETIQQMLREMRRNLNLGIGYAIPTETIAVISSLVKSLII